MIIEKSKYIMSYLSAFTNQMEAFASELTLMFPDDVDLKMALNMIKLINNLLNTND